MRRKFGSQSVLGVLALLMVVGCGRHAGVAANSQYDAATLPDVSYCKTLTAQYNPSSPSHLSQRDIQKLESLQQQPSQISCLATATLAAYAKDDPDLMQKLILRSSMLESDPNPYVKYSGVQIAVWYKLADESPKIDLIEKQILENADRNGEEEELLKLIGTYRQTVKRSLQSAPSI
jgi:hypothetical protein